MDLLKYSPFPDLAAALRARLDSILQRWGELVVQKLPGADELTLEQLRDHLPAVLEKIAVALESKGGESMSDLREVSESHGETRFHQSFNVNELLVEYGLLRPVVIDEVMAHLGRDATRDEIAVLNMSLDAAVRRSVTQFLAYQEKQLKTITGAQSKYLSFLSHDLRGGLNGVLLMAEVLKRELANEPRFAESVEDLDAMRRSILDTVATMDRFLHAERFRQGKVQPKNSTVDLRAVTADLSHQLSHQAKEKGIDLDFKFKNGSVAHTDKDLLALILQNLIGNAIKYTPRGSVRVVVEPPADGRGVRIAVQDQGPGISPEHLANLFEPFQRGETHGQPGVGLGLSIAHQAAELIGAKLRATSTVGKGSTFTLDL
ncbi:MAG TPA: sensor histidine kinase, partial [Tepidisphaeraceae bacterium]|nr:sensor histidine kinase [Tepidisphaeraceae bacterium]